MMLGRLSRILLPAIFATAPAWPQSVPIQTLSQPNATFHHGFTHVAGIHELGDGRVIVLDSYDRTVQLLGAYWLTMSQIGREGSGPGEYQFPSRIFSLGGDSAAVLDGPNRRILVITPDGKPGGFLDPHRAVTRPRIQPQRVSATDQLGRFYARALAIVESVGGDLQLADSAAIERWPYSYDGPFKRDTVGFLPVVTTSGRRIVAGMVVGTATPEPFAARNEWAVGADGRLAIVHVQPYRVDLVDATGTIRSGQPIDFERIKVSDRHKQEWREDQQRPRPFTVLTRDGGSSVQLMPGPYTEPEKWPKYLPPFLRDAVHFASDGMLWVQRTTPAGDPPTFDIIDRIGRVVQQVKLPHSSRLVRFGDGWLYLVRIDQLDLEYLERYRLPGAR